MTTYPDISYRIGAPLVPGNVPPDGGLQRGQCGCLTLRGEGRGPSIILILCDRCELLGREAWALGLLDAEYPREREGC